MFYVENQQIRINKKKCKIKSDFFTIMIAAGRVVTHQTPSFPPHIRLRPGILPGPSPDPAALMKTPQRRTRITPLIVAMRGRRGGSRVQIRIAGGPSMLKRRGRRRPPPTPCPRIAPRAYPRPVMAMSVGRRQLMLQLRGRRCPKSVPKALGGDIPCRGRLFPVQLQLLTETRRDRDPSDCCDDVGKPSPARLLHPLLLLARVPSISMAAVSWLIDWLVLLLLILMVMVVVLVSRWRMEQFAFERWALVYFVEKSVLFVPGWGGVVGGTVVVAGAAGVTDGAGTGRGRCSGGGGWRRGARGIAVFIHDNNRYGLKTWRCVPCSPGVEKKWNINQSINQSIDQSINRHITGQIRKPKVTNITFKLVTGHVIKAKFYPGNSPIQGSQAFLFPSSRQRLSRSVGNAKFTVSGNVRQWAGRMRSVLVPFHSRWKIWLQWKSVRKSGQKSHLERRERGQKYVNRKNTV